MGNFNSNSSSLVQSQVTLIIAFNTCISKINVVFSAWIRQVKVSLDC